MTSLIDVMAEQRSEWTSAGKIRACRLPGGVELVVDGLTTQGRYYKPLIYEFFRKDWRDYRPAHGEFEVDILMEYQGDPPWLDLDNLAKAILDGLTGHVFHDDSQVARLLVQRRSGERERVTVRADLRTTAGPAAGS